MQCTREGVCAVMGENMIPFFSKRNQVYGCLYKGYAAVEKHFRSMDDWQRETDTYSALAGKLSVPAILCCEPGILITEYCPQKTFLSLLNEQEQTGFSPIPWLTLARWLRCCQEICGKLPTEGNLRNFLWDEKTCTVLGLDLESYEPIEPSVCGALIIAALLAYDPADTSVKRQAAATLAEALAVSEEQISSACEKLLFHRRNKDREPVSGVILAGGNSLRMGRDKAKLSFMGQNICKWQVAKLRLLGIEDIILSGTAVIPGVRTVPDVYQGRGPLGGIHACLQAAHHKRCLVLGVDVPLTPLSALSHLMRCHTGGVTVLRHGDKIEPLMGMYDRDLVDHVAAIIEKGSAPVRALQQYVPWQYFDYLGPEELLGNCNTPEELARLEEMAISYQKAGILLC